MRNVYVISDLHLGGDYPDPPGSGRRGFRLCTRCNVVAQFIDSLTEKFPEEDCVELVLNGDTVDFLAEHGDSPTSWSPFTAEPDRALTKFNRIAERDRVIFEALERFLDAGGRITVLLGNHDIELSFPAVRTAFRHALGVKPGHDFEFLYDGEAYVVGDALIEHGNRYDAWNQVDYDALRRVRSFQSRLQTVPEEYAFVPPPGSEMVTQVINPIKLDYAFVDLLKPETAAAIPMLLALEPGYRSRLATIALLYKRTRSHGVTNASTPRYGGDIRAERNVEATIPNGAMEGATGMAKTGFGDEISSAGNGSAIPFRSEKNEALKETLKAALGNDAENFLRELDDEIEKTAPLERLGEAIAAGDGVSRLFGFAALLLGRSSQSYQARLPALLKAMRGVQGTFDVSTENAKEYLDAARSMVGHGLRYVVFGHTHQAKRVPLGDNCFYLNSGTWADVLQFPDDIFKSDAEALPALSGFVAKIKNGDFSEWTLFRPTYVRLKVGDDGRVSEADLLTFAKAG